MLLLASALKAKELLWKFGTTLHLDLTSPSGIMNSLISYIVESFFSISTMRNQIQKKELFK